MRFLGALSAQPPGAAYVSISIESATSQGGFISKTIRNTACTKILTAAFGDVTSQFDCPGILQTPSV